MSAFQPRFCPRATCPSRTGAASFSYYRDGTFPRLADGRRVPRYRCKACRRRFSAQTFRLDFRHKKPQLNTSILSLLVSKVTLRQTARILGVDRKTVHHRLRLFGHTLRELHQAFLERAIRNGGLFGTFSLDELETFEHNRRLKPLTVPVLIHRPTRFLVHFEVGKLPARGGLKGRDLERKEAQGPRLSESTPMVRRCLETLKRVHEPGELLQLVVDQKRTYKPLVKQLFGNRIAALVTESSKTARNPANPLFAINHTLATLRDHASRLVRRTWACTKRARELARHCWVVAVWKNYARPASNRMRRASAGMMLGLTDRIWSLADLLRWRWPRLALAAA
jgi:transposase-like protein